MDNPSAYDTRTGQRITRAVQPGSLNPSAPLDRLTITSALTRTDEYIAQLHQTISELMNHLSLILAAPEPTSAPKKQPESPQIADRILRQGEEINDARIRLDCLIATVQL